VSIDLDESNVLQSASFSTRFQPHKIHAALVCRQSFPHLWKKLWKSRRKSTVTAVSSK